MHSNTRELQLLLSFILLLVSFSLINIVQAVKTKVIIDNDAGTDDAVAILMALEAHRRGDIEIIALTTTFGNADLENVNKNNLRLLQLTELLDEIPIYPGSKSSLRSLESEFEADYHGSDGFGNAKFDTPEPPIGLLENEFAPIAIKRLVEENEGEVVLVAIGPLTNVATAMKMSSNFTEKLKDFYIMGGNTRALGNMAITAEFNFFADPESAKIVLENSQTPINLAPLEICYEKGTFTLEERRMLGQTDSKASKFLNKIEHQILSTNEIWTTFDEVAIAWFLNDHASGIRATIGDMQCKSTSYWATVELMGEYTRGQTVIEKRQSHIGILPRNVNFLEDFNVEVYIRYLKLGFGFGQINK